MSFLAHVLNHADVLHTVIMQLDAPTLYRFCGSAKRARRLVLRSLGADDIEEDDELDLTVRLADLAVSGGEGAGGGGAAGRFWMSDGLRHAIQSRCRARWRDRECVVARIGEYFEYDSENIVDGRTFLSYDSCFILDERFLVLYSEYWNGFEIFDCVTGEAVHDDWNLPHRPRDPSDPSMDGARKDDNVPCCGAISGAGGAIACFFERARAPRPTPGALVLTACDARDGDAGAPPLLHVPASHSSRKVSALCVVSARRQEGVGAGGGAAAAHRGHRVVVVEESIHDGPFDDRAHARRWRDEHAQPTVVKVYDVSPRPRAAPAVTIAELVLGEEEASIEPDEGEDEDAEDAFFGMTVARIHHCACADGIVVVLREERQVGTSVHIWDLAAVTAPLERPRYVWQSEAIDGVAALSVHVSEGSSRAPRGSGGGRALLIAMGSGSINGARALWHASIDRFFADDAARGDGECEDAPPERAFDDYLWTDVADDPKWMEQFARGAAPQDAHGVPVEVSRWSFSAVLSPCRTRSEG